MSGDVPFAIAREKRLYLLAENVAENVDGNALLPLIEEGSPDPPFVPPGAPPSVGYSGP